MNEPKLKSYIVTEIEFDYDDGNNMESYSISYDEQVANRDNALGIWFAYDDEERALKDSIESQLYEVREQDLLIGMKIVSSHINPLGGN